MMSMTIMTTVKVTTSPVLKEPRRMEETMKIMPTAAPSSVAVKLTMVAYWSKKSGTKRSVVGGGGGAARAGAGATLPPTLIGNPRNNERRTPSTDCARSRGTGTVAASDCSAFAISSAVA